MTAKVGDKTLFLAEAVQAGIFQVRNVPAADLEPLLGIACPTIVFPYLRETISDLVARGGFPPVLLAPVSFEALYLQRHAAGAARRRRPKIEAGAVSRVAVLGAGAWGTAIAARAAARLDVALWARDAAQATTIARNAAQRALPAAGRAAGSRCGHGGPSPGGVRGAAARGDRPVAGLRESSRGAQVPLVWLCKGFEPGRGLLPHPDRRRGAGRGAPSARCRDRRSPRKWRAASLRAYARVARRRLRAGGRRRAARRAHPRLLRATISSASRSAAR